VKTISLKKVSAVAVASLGFGLLSVVPAYAGAGDITMTYNFTATGSTATPTVGTAVVIPMTLATSSVTTDTTGATATVTAELTTLPANSALDAQGATTSTVSGNLFPTDEATMAATASTSSVGAKLTATVVAAAATQSATVVGSFGFTPDTAGKYVMTITVADTNATVANSVTTSAITTDTVEIIVGGASLVQAASGLGTGTGTQAVGNQSAVAVFLPAASDSTSRYSVTATGATIVGAFSGTAAVTTANTYTATSGITKNNGADYAAGFTFAGQNTVTAVTGSSDQTDAFVVQMTSAATGPATLTVRTINSTTGVTSTLYTATVTYGAAPAISAGNSTAFLSEGSDCATSDDVGGVTLARTASTSVQATICVLVKDQNAVAVNGSAITATISGPGLISIKTSNTTGDAGGARAAALTATTQANTNASTIGISADGTAGVGTITITAGTTVIATKSITFYGSAAKYTATTILNAVANGSTTTDAVVVCATDSAGIAVPSAVIYATSGDTTVASVATSATTVSSAVTEDLDTGSANTVIAPAAYQAAKAVGCAGFAVTAASQIVKDSVVITFRDSATAALATVSATATVKVGSVAASSITLTADKTSYAAGEKMVLTLTFKDAAGRLVGAGPGTATLDDVLVSSASLSGDALFAANNNTKLGVKTATVYAPLSGGTLTISGETGVAGTYVAAAAAGKALSLTPTVANPNAAILTQIDALNAKIVALNALIAKIMKKLGVR
jgi:hypothetical protein